MTSLVTRIEEITPEWLTDTLKRHAVLTQGVVTKVNCATSTPYRSIVSRLTLTYSTDAPPSAPTRLFFKMSNPDLGSDSPDTKREIAFYQAIAGESGLLPVPRCYEAVWDDTTKRFHVLLDDLSETHFSLEPPIPPAKRHAEQAIDCLAVLHAFFWDSSRLGSPPFPMPKSEAAEIIEQFPGFCDILGDNLSAERRRLFEKAIDALPRLFDQRLASGQRLTLVHGDAHAWNFLYPHDPVQNSARLLDWEVMGVNPGTNDLAYMMVLFWYPERRAWLERPLVQRYHAGLVQHSVTNYSWEECWEDYRLSTLHKLFEPLWWSAHDTPHLWWDRLERVLMAFDDLHCIEFLS